MRSVVVGIGGVGRGRVGSVLSRVVSFVLLKLCPCFQKQRTFSGWTAEGLELMTLQLFSKKMQGFSSVVVANLAGKRLQALPG